MHDSAMQVEHTYYDNVPGMPDQSQLLNLWAESWQRKGLATRILTDKHARMHPGSQDETKPLPL